MTLPILELTEDMQLVEPSDELEVKLCQVGCPHPPGPLASAWLDGCAAGIKEGARITREAFLK